MLAGQPNLQRRGAPLSRRARLRAAAAEGAAAAMAFLVSPLLGFGGGMLLRDRLNQVSLPSLHRSVDTKDTFKLSVRIVAASVPALPAPGTWTRQRPKVEVTLGDVQKETEFADFVGKDDASFAVGTCARECPWRFGDTLTFIATLRDVKEGGLKLRLRGHSDVNLGPVMFHLTSVSELGQGCVDLRRRALPACERDRRSASGDAAWESPVLLIPIVPVRGGVVTDGHQYGEPTAHVALSFSLNVDPDEILQAIDAQSRQVWDVMESKADHAISWLVDSKDSDPGVSCMPGGFRPGSAVGYVPGSSLLEEPPWLPQSCAGTPREDAFSSQRWDATLTPRECQLAAERASARHPPWNPDPVLLGPELAPEGWISRKGPNGKVFWHHRALGPAPWEAAEAQEAARAGAARAGGVVPPSVRSAPQLSQPCNYAGAGAPAARSTSFGTLISPDLPPDGWVCHRRPDGRTFWHHTSLGPAPWEAPGAGAGRLAPCREEW